MVLVQLLATSPHATTVPVDAAVNFIVTCRTSLQSSPLHSHMRRCHGTLAPYSHNCCCCLLSCNSQACERCCDRRLEVSMFRESLPFQSPSAVCLSNLGEERRTPRSMLMFADQPSSLIFSVLAR
ncbi:uncharacterized protein LOC135097153 [Scylla paramamosain]|uniref:uncharacterized protein LOC135097153 n=1 Tax=Scylla paramamosain TaxID=85552 RepID=UPI0030839176